MTKEELNRFGKSVFINCPFDKDYNELLKPLLFVLKKIGLFPRIASESLNSAEVRLEKIKRLILASKYSIHDLSRNYPKSLADPFRMNMPFELGLDYGCMEFHQVAVYKQKLMLILEDEPYSLKKAISDISFADCKHHKNDPERLVEEVRNWFSENGFDLIPGPTALWNDYNEFLSELYVRKIRDGFSSPQIETLPIPEFIRAIDHWITNGRNNE